jgi:hypothetical protein
MGSTREGICKHKVMFDRWLEGKEIQYFVPGSNRWESVEYPVWLETSQYRVRPERKTVTKWANCYNSSELYNHSHVTIHDNRESADNANTVLALTEREACVPVTISWILGEGLDH